LIEVLVVVAIIALLVAILIPTLSKARKQARRVVCGSNLHQIAIGLLTYRESFKEYPEPATVGGAAQKGFVFGLMTEDTHRLLGKLLKTGYKNSTDPDDVRAGELWYCPEVKEADRFGDEEGLGQIDADSEPYIHTTFMYLARMDGAQNDPARCNVGLYGDETNCDPRKDIPARRRNYVIKEPDARKVMMADMMMYWAHAPGGPRWRINHLSTYVHVGSAGKVPFEGMNMGYGDGHVEWRGKARFPDIFASDLQDRTREREILQSVSLNHNGDLWWWY
jgi:prepilin-type processing-associated H-X9-DG protein